MLNIIECQEIIEQQLGLLNFAGKKPVELYQPISYILRLGGKRIRPVSTLLACNLFSGQITQSVKAALAIEVFHNFTLIHDDIMDKAALRRNKPTVHTKWNENIAILSGDAMQIVAYQLLCDTDQKILPLILTIFNSTALKVCEGQQYDMNFASLENVSLSDYIHMIELKTSVLLASSLKIGALCGGAPEEEAQKLYEFGRNLGLAFQIKDDYLDVYANQEMFGKTVGGDIAENKKTFLLIKAIELAKGEHSAILKKAISNEFPTIFDKIEKVRKIYDELTIPQITCNKIAEYSVKAFEYLNMVNVEKSKTEILREFAYQLINREK